MRIQPDRLLASAFMKPTSQRALAEEIVQMAMDDLRVEKISDDVLLEAERIWGPATVACTGGLFVLPIHDMPPINDANWDPEELPPMPFKRCWFELWNEEEQLPGAFLGWNDYDGEELLLVGLAVIEVAGGEEWRVYSVNESLQTHKLVIVAWDLLAGEALDGMRSHPDASVVGADDLHGDARVGVRQERIRGDWIRTLTEDEVQKLISLQKLPIVLAQIIDLLGITHSVVSVPRQTRRQFERRFGQEHPRIYLVNLRETGEPGQPGKGGIVYQHRWIVRGHYRREENGRFMIRSKGRCTWVRPYVKGPAGAPWKGRPIYAVNGDVP